MDANWEGGHLSPTQDGTPESHLSPSVLGDVHIGMIDRSGQLEVEVIQARGLTPKLGSKSIPGRYLC